MSIKCAVYFILGPIIIIILWVTTQTQLFLTPKKKSEQGSGLSSLGRIIRKNKVSGVVPFSPLSPFCLCSTVGAICIYCG